MFPINDSPFIDDSPRFSWSNHVLFLSCCHVSPVKSCQSCHWETPAAPSAPSALHISGKKGWKTQGDEPPNLNQFSHPFFRRDVAKSTNKNR